MKLPIFHLGFTGQQDEATLMLQLKELCSSVNHKVAWEDWKLLFVVPDPLSGMTSVSYCFCV